MRGQSVLGAGLTALRSLGLRRGPTPDPTHLVARSEGRDYPVELRRRPGARRMTLRVSTATGAAVLTVPQRTDLRSAEAFVGRQAAWIATRLARLPDRIAFVPGALVPLRGQPHRIAHRPPQRGPARIETTSDGDSVIAVGGTAEAVPGRVKRFLAAEAEGDLRVAVTRYAAAAERAVGRLTIRDTKTRWGSCSSKGALSFSWRLILAPPFVLDYLAAHEVAHLVEMNHSERYWAVLRGLCPRTAEAEAWLKRHGSGLHRYG